MAKEYLVNVNTGVVVNRSDRWAARDDMAPCTVKGDIIYKKGHVATKKGVEDPEVTAAKKKATAEKAAKTKADNKAKKEAEAKAKKEAEAKAKKEAEGNKSEGK